MHIVHLRASAIALALTFAACGGKGTDGGGEAGGGEPGLDAAALVGTWSGTFGTFTLADGKGKLVLRNCGYEVEGPGRIKMPEDTSKCDENTYEGEVRVKGYEIAIGDPAKMMHKFGAYLDAAGQLHLGISVRQDVSKLENKAGDVTVSMFDTLHVGADGKCTLTSKMDRKEGPKDVPCRFETVGGKEIFVYTSEGEEQGMVYLAKEGLVVPDSVEAMVFTKGK